jgi:hypothetical protein
MKIVLSKKATGPHIVDDRVMFLRAINIPNCSGEPVRLDATKTEFRPDLSILQRRCGC